MTRLPAGGGAKSGVVSDRDRIVDRAEPGGIDPKLDFDPEKVGNLVDDGMEPGADAAAYVIDLAGFPGFEQPTVGVGDVAHIQKVADDLDVAGVEHFVA